MDPRTAIACVVASSMLTHCLAPSRVSTLGSQGQGSFAFLLDPNRGVLSDCSVQLGACLYRVSRIAYRVPIPSHCLTIQTQRTMRV